MSLFSTCGWILRLGVTIALLVSIHPALALLALFALPPVLTSTWRPASSERAYERGASVDAPGAPPVRHGDHGGAGQGSARHRHRRSSDRERRLAWESANRPIAAARWSSAGWHTLAWAIFGAGYVGAIVFVSSALRAPAGDVLLALAAGSRLSFYVGATVGEIGFLRGSGWMLAKRLAWLEDYAASLVAAGRSARAARACADGIRFEHVSFAYPGTDRARARRHQPRRCPPARSSRSSARTAPASRRWSSCSPKMYEPTSGRILIDGTDLARIAGRRTGARAWPARSRTSSASSSGRVRRSASAISPRLDDEPAVADGGRAAPAPTT